MNSIPKIKIYNNNNNFFLIAGPCIIEEEKLSFNIAERILEITDKLKIPFIFKGSYKKANRSRIDSFTGIGDNNALQILKKIGDNLNIPTITDIHETTDCDFVKDYVDILQIPAFLIRQTDLLVSAGKTGKFINLKKAQFISPQAIEFAVNKVMSTGNKNILITERGTMFGYKDLIIDYTGIPIMRQFAPTILDITHSLQQPNTENGITGGKPEMIETIAKAGIAVGCDGIFLETHPEPFKSKSDGANMLKLDLLEDLLTKLVAIRKTINSF